jgi:hypothetical protein
VNAWKRPDGKKFTFTGYDAGKPTLFADQHQKRGYARSARAGQVPRRRTLPTEGPLLVAAWTWENLLFACFECNREYKKQQFPLADESHRLVAAVPPGQDSCLDPFDPSIDLATTSSSGGTVPGKER